MVARCGDDGDGLGAGTGARSQCSGDGTGDMCDVRCAMCGLGRDGDRGQDDLPMRGTERRQRRGAGSFPQVDSIR
jgi:hypothetical protein